MSTPRFVARALWVGLMVLSAGAVSGQDYPNRPIRIVTSEPGGGSSFAARMIAQGLTDSLGQQVIVENRAGVIPAEIVSKAQPDGYTILVDGTSFWVAPLLQRMPYDVVRDFSPITPLTAAPSVLVVNPALAANSVKELIALAKAKPGVLNYGSAATGSPNHLTAELFKIMTGVDIVRVHYKGIALALNALVSGEVQLSFPSAAGVAPFHKAGRVWALAVTSAQPSALVPGLPTVAASGLPGYESVSRTGIFAPVKTSGAIISRLNQEIVRAINKTDVKEKFFTTGAEVYSSTPGQFAAAIRSDIDRWGKVIKDAGIRPD